MKLNTSEESAAAEIYSDTGSDGDPPAGQVFTSDSDSDSDEPKAGNVYQSESEGESPLPDTGSDDRTPAAHVYTSDSDNDDAVADGFTSDSYSEDPAARMVYQSESDNDCLPAAGVFTSSDSGDDIPAAAAVYGSDEYDDEALGRQLLETIEGGHLSDVGENRDDDQDMTPLESAAIPSIPGPFNASTFSTVPSSWMDTVSDDGEPPSDDKDDV